MAWMYILECADGSYYVGSTKDLERQMAEHLSGLGSRYTSGRMPVKLVYGEEYEEFQMLMLVRSRYKIGVEPNAKH